MKSYFGSYKPSHSAGEVSSTILVFDKEVHIGYDDANGKPVTIVWPIRQVRSDFHTGQQQTAWRFEGSTLLVNGPDADRVIRSLQDDLARPWHQRDKGREIIRNTLLFTGIIGVLVLIYFLIVPWLSEQLAGRISQSTEARVGNAAYEAMNLQPREDARKSLVINDFFDRMQIQTSYNIRISVVNDNTMNAFALPGGRIVVFTGLLDKIDSYPELAALLSHEFTHVNNKHSTRSIFRRLGSKVFIGLLFGKFGSVTSVVMDHADNLKSLKYSRKLEKEADLEGLAILKARSIDPRGFNDLLLHLKQSVTGRNTPELLESHPDIDDRIAYIREASVNTSVTENAELKAIFDKLKNR